MTDPLMPEEYRLRRQLHDDWPWPLCYIPRAWTGRSYPLPFKQIAGDAPVVPHLFPDNGYPPSPVYKSPGGYVMAADPVPPLGCWTLQARWVPSLKIWLPCYLAFSVKLPFLPVRWHMNGFLKPDITSAPRDDGTWKFDWYCWYEFSNSFARIE